jgi:glycosyltransferase involved in cell wall biosynthesis
MHLALSIEALAPEMGGIGRYTWELAKRLPHRPEIDTIRYWRNGRWTRDAGPFVRAMPTSRRSLVPLWVRNLQGSATMRRRLFHGTNYFLPRGAEGGVVTAMDLSVFHQPEFHPIERVRFFETNVPDSMERAGAIITCSNTIRDELITFFDLSAERVTVVPLGVSDIFKPHTAKEMAPVLARHGLEAGGYALSVATLEPRKRFPDLLNAWRALPHDIRHRWPLAVAGGKGWLSDNIRDQLERGVTAGWVRELGYVPEADLPALYAGSALFIYPSTYEGFGLPPIEAMASGVPVVVANASCLPEVTRGAAMLVHPLDIEGFAENLTRALTDGAWRRDAVSRGYDVAAGYSWDACVEKTVSVYRTLLSCRN